MAGLKTKSLSELKSWYQDSYQTIVVQRNVLLIIAITALVGLGFSVASVATLNASKIFEPFLIEVEEKTGAVTQINRKDIEEYTSQEAIIRYFLAKYINARESYSVEDYRYFYYKVVPLLSKRDVNKSFRNEIGSDSNRNSPLKLAQNFVREVKIKSMSPLENKRWQVRYLTRDYKMPDYVVKKEKHYIATINFDFFRLSLSEQDRYINPLGFKVTHFRRDGDQGK